MKITTETINTICKAIREAYRMTNDSIMNLDKNLHSNTFARIFRDILQTELKNILEVDCLIRETTSYYKFRIGNIILMVDSADNSTRDAKKKHEFSEGQYLLFEEEEQRQEDINAYLIYDIECNEIRKAEIRPVSNLIRSVTLFSSFEDLLRKAAMADSDIKLAAYKTEEVKEDLDFEMVDGKSEAISNE